MSFIDLAACRSRAPNSATNKCIPRLYNQEPRSLTTGVLSAFEFWVCVCVRVGAWAASQRLGGALQKLAAVR